MLHLHQDILRFNSPNRCCVMYSGFEMPVSQIAAVNGGGRKICFVAVKDSAAT